MKKLVISLEENTAGRDFVVSDVHGSFDLLEAALEAVKFNPKNDRLISVGDLVNYGPYSEKCISYLKQPWFFHLQGNHETMVLEAYKDGAINNERIAKDKKNRLQWILAVSKEDLDYMRETFAELPVIIEIKTSQGTVGFVHGDIPEGMDWATFKDKINAHDKKTIEAAIFSRSKIKTGNTSNIEGISRVFLGHTPIENGPVTLGNCFFIDTGGVFKHINNNNPQNLYLTLADIKANADDICTPKATKHKLVRVATAKIKPPFKS